MTILQPRASRSRAERAPGRIAVLLNARAKGWTGSIHQDVLRYVSGQDLFLTDDFQQAKRSVGKLLSMQPDVIFAGGGDGTIMYLLNEIEARVRAGSIAREDVPVVGVLRLGTGNALANYLKASDIISDLRALREGAQLNVYDVSMLQSSDGTLFPFAGFGWDADILNDYDLVKDAVRDTAVENYITGLGGYSTAIAMRTIPRAIRQAPMRVRLTNTGERAFRINFQGDVLQEFERGEVIYEGMSRICGAASMPYWGFQIRMFPHADRFDGFFQCRCFHGGVTELVTRLRRFWKGQLKEESIHDLLCQKLHVELLSEPAPYQVSGDTAGIEREIHWQIAPHPVRLATPLSLR